MTPYVEEYLKKNPKFANFAYKGEGSTRKTNQQKVKVLLVSKLAKDPIPVLTKDPDLLFKVVGFTT
jgi:hypothetical protein